MITEKLEYDMRLKIDHYKLIPKVSGVYLFYDNQNQIIYIGKAKSLYFRIQQHLYGKGSSITNTYDIKHHFTHVSCVFETSIYNHKITINELEKYLIKKLKPKFNVVMNENFSERHDITYFTEEGKIRIAKVETEKEKRQKYLQEKFIKSMNTWEVL